MSKPTYFKVPKCLKHKEARKAITNLVRNMNEKGLFTESDVPNLCRMAIAYDMYLSCVDTIYSEDGGMTMINLKGELVKRPEVNIMRESWSQYLELAKEYGLTTRSKGLIKSLKSDDETKSPIENFI